MEKQTFYLVNDRIRANAMAALAKADKDAVVTLSPKRRTNDQNALLWSLLSELADARPEGRQWTPETWKCAFMHLLGHQVRFCEGLDGSGPFPMGFRSSKLTVGQMTDLIECILEYGTRHGVEFSKEMERA